MGQLSCQLRLDGNPPPGRPVLLAQQQHHADGGAVDLAVRMCLQACLLPSMLRHQARQHPDLDASAARPQASGAWSPSGQWRAHLQLLDRWQQYRPAEAAAVQLTDKELPEHRIPPEQVKLEGGSSASALRCALALCLAPCGWKPSGSWPRI